MKLFQKTEMEGKLGDEFSEASVTFSPAGQGPARGEGGRPVALMNRDANVLTRGPATRTQRHLERIVPPTGWICSWAAGLVRPPPAGPGGLEVASCGARARTPGAYGRFEVVAGRACLRPALWPLRGLLPCSGLRSLAPDEALQVPSVASGAGVSPACWPRLPGSRASRA